MTPLIQVRPGWIDAKTKAAMIKAGYLVVEVPEGETVTVIVPCGEIPPAMPSDLTLTATILTDMARWKNETSSVTNIKSGVLDALGKLFAETVKAAKEDPK